MIVSIAMGAEYLSYVKSIATFAPTFYGHIISVLASVKTFAIKGNTEPYFINACNYLACHALKRLVGCCDN